MKLAIIFFFLVGIFSLVVAIPSPSTKSSGITVREPSFYDDSIYYYERSEIDDDTFLGERYADYSNEVVERELEMVVVEERLIQAILGVARGIVQVVNLIKGQIEHDKDKRGQWTSEMANKFHQQYPHFNFVLCHTEHKTDFKGTKGVDWNHMHQELPVSFGKTVGFEIYWFKEGTFHRIGDGGFLNWAYSGNIKSRSKDGKDVVFGPL